MAKVSTIKCEVNGTPYTINVNCNSYGEFNANIPEFVATALRVESRLSANTLSELESKFNASLKQYKEAETKEELFIAISYRARGKYIEKPNGDHLFYHDNRKYGLRVDFNRPENALGLDFHVIIKETIDQKVKWHEAVLGSNVSHILRDSYPEDNVWYKDKEFYHVDDYKLIPFSEVALQSLENAQEKIRSISEFLFNFIEQDEEQILLTLTSQKLLN